MKTTRKPLPELLAPAGTPEALDAAIAAGADAVYFGASAFNARMMAKNFEGDTLREAFRKCRYYGVKTNITLNILVHDREIRDMLACAEELYTLGADTLIVADLGAARLIHHYFPEMELHASTQAAGHNTLAARELSKLGFTRMVAARELSFDDLSTICRESPIETELFIHGAICVSQSGGCLASSLIGGRSGNRGECAQPCRLPYHGDCKEKGRKRCEYPLSLKDMCLAGHIPELLSLGAASLKIEGRMKPPEYVYGVVSIWRRLLDEGRNATAEEMNALRALFSRSGFTDGYFVKKINHDMLGVRTDADKALTAAGKTQAPDYTNLMENRRRETDIRASFAVGEPSMLTMRCGDNEVSVTGQAPEKALNRPLTEETAAKNLTKLGGTPFMAKNIDISISGDPILPISALNALRRDAVGQLTEKLFPPRPPKDNSGPPAHRDIPDTAGSARFENFREIPENIREAAEYVFIPLESFHDFLSYAMGDKAWLRDVVNGVAVPPVVFDSETDEIRGMLREAADNGIRHALVSNLGHLKLATDAGMVPHGDHRLNIYNRYTADALLDLGFADLIASPELTIPQLRTLSLPFAVYGRIPLMTLQKCCIKEFYSCDECAGRGFLPLIDRRDTAFPLRRCFRHRNILYNSVPLWMCDRKSELQGCSGSAHFIFTDEKKKEAATVIDAWENGSTTDKKIRRIPK